MSKKTDFKTSETRPLRYRLQLSGILLILGVFLISCGTGRSGAKFTESRSGHSSGAYDEARAGSNTVDVRSRLAGERSHADHSEIGRQNRHLLIIVDGLRADYVTPEIMPNVTALAENGVFGLNSSAVLPTFTRPNRASLPTGVLPGKHGIIHNEILHPSKDAAVHTGNLETMTAYAVASGTPVITVPSLGELMEQEGKKLLTIGYGSWLLNHTGAGKGWQMPGNFSGDPEKAEEILSAVGRAPEGGRGPKRTVWAVDLYLHDAVSSDPADAVLMWFGETDATGHAYGVGAPETLEAVSHVDHQIGRLVQKLEALGLDDKVNIFLTSDHGFTQSEGGFQLGEMIQKAGLQDHAQSVRNMIYINNGDPVHLKQMVEALQRDELVGSIYTRPARLGDAEGRVPGTLSTDLIGWTHERTPDILAIPAWDVNKNEFGWRGTTSRNGTASHGTDSPHDRHIPFVAAGPDIKPGVESDVPTGNIDFSPTLLYLLGLEVPDHMDGRVLHEVLVGGVNPEDIEVQETVDAVSVQFRDGFIYQTALVRKWVDSTWYLQEGRTERTRSVIAE